MFIMDMVNINYWYLETKQLEESCSCHSCKRVFECMQESKKVARLIDYRKQGSMVISNASDSCIRSKTRYTGMTRNYLPKVS